MTEVSDYIVNPIKCVKFPVGLAFCHFFGGTVKNTLYMLGLYLEALHAENANNHCFSLLRIPLLVQLLLLLLLPPQLLLLLPAGSASTAWGVDRPSAERGTELAVQGGRQVGLNRREVIVNGGDQ